MSKTCYIPEQMDEATRVMKADARTRVKIAKHPFPWMADFATIKPAASVDFIESMRHLVIVESEVVSELVNHGLAYFPHGLMPRAGNAVDWAAKHGDLVRQQRHVMRPFGERDATVDAKELRIAVGIALDALEVVIGRLVLDRDDDVLDEVGEPFRKRFQRFADHALEFSTR